MNDEKIVNDRKTVERTVIEIVARSLDRPVEEVTLTSRFWGELDAESLDLLDIVYGLERRFRIRMPRLNLLQRASDMFGEGVIVQGGVVTDIGLAMMRLSMPEVPSEWMKPGMRVYDFRKVITVGTFARIVERCLAAVEDLRCAECGGKAIPSERSEMSLQCAVCGKTIDLPAGEQLLVEDLHGYARTLNLPFLEPVAGAGA